MNIATRLGLPDERFARMVVTTKMLLSNVLGHAAELHYEKELTREGVPFVKAPTDVSYDYTVQGNRDQVKRFESASTDDEFVGANLTKTHGDRNGPGGFYQRTGFDRLVLFDVGFRNKYVIPAAEIPENPRYADRFPGRYRMRRPANLSEDAFLASFLRAMKAQNSHFFNAIESLRAEYDLTYLQLLERVCGLTADEIDGLFSDDNFRLVVGAKGFAGEEHFNMLLDEWGIPYVQIRDMYSKHDHMVRARVRAQVKTPYVNGTDETHIAFKTHKSHGHGVGELYRADEFDVVALFTGFEMDPAFSRYIPVRTTSSFIFIPAGDLEQHPDFPGHLKRVTRVPRDRYSVNSREWLDN